MTLSQGTQLGSFEITSLLGVGGMGEVYRARDTKLGREVAIKVLPEVFAASEERSKRFEREARMLAALDHPNIAGIYDFQEAEGHKFLVMQLVEGQTLADRIADGAIPIDEALPLFAQIAEALESAHEQGIVHRDLKPANIKVTEEGKVKLLDFGLARMFGGAASVGWDPDAPTLVDSALTAEFTILGTPSYMSPEQARGGAVDKRTDIWAFGCCLFEALSGRSPFEGQTISDILSEILKGQPDFSALPPETPERLRGLIGRCLEKDPAWRLRDIGDARIELGALGGSDRSGSLHAYSPSAEKSQPQQVHWAITAAALLIALVAVIWGATRKKGPEAGRSSPAARATAKQFKVRLPPDAPLYAEGAGLSMTIERGGRRLVYVSEHPDGTRLSTLDLRTGEAETIEGTEGALDPFISPDGRWVGYFTYREMRKAPLLGGGPVVTLLSVPPVPQGASWGSEGRIVFAPLPNSGLAGFTEIPFRVEPVTTVDRAGGESSHRWPQALPGGGGSIFTSIIGQDFQDVKDSRIMIVPADVDGPCVIAEGIRYARYVVSGHLVVARGGSLFARSFDPAQPNRRHEEVLVLEEVLTNGDDLLPQFTVSGEGTLVYAGGGIRENVHRYELVWVDRKGETTPIEFPAGYYSTPSLSPLDDNLLAVTVLERSNERIWIHDLERGSGYLLTSESGREFAPRWTPDARRIVFTSFHQGLPALSMKGADGSGRATVLTSSSHADFPNSVSPLDQTMVFTRVYMEDTSAPWKKEMNSDLWLYDLSERKAMRPFVETPFIESGAAISPERHWIAYVSEEEGRQNVYLQSFPEGGRRYKLSPSGGAEIRWHPKFPEPRELFYRSGEGVWIVRGVTAKDSPAGTPQEMFSGPYIAQSYEDQTRAYDVASDGERFLMMKAAADRPKPITELTVIVNWFEELKRLAPAESD